MTSFDIKILAFTFMLIDHIGRLFFPDATIMVAIGRLSFPLFAWLAAMGERYTSDIKKYVIRLILLGIISQPIYSYVYFLIFNTEPQQLNILFTLAIGITTIRLSRLSDNPIIKSIIVLTILLLAFICNFTTLPCLEGGMYGLTTIYFLSLFNSRQIEVRWWISFISMNLFFWYFFHYPNLELMKIFAPMLIMIFYNHQQGIKSKWIYTLYPLHFAILAIVNTVLK